MKNLRIMSLLVAAFAAVLALAGPALADTTVKLTVGPVPVPKVPVKVCIETDGADPLDECVTTPAGDSVSLTIKARVKSVDPVVVKPSVTPVACPAGTNGVAAKVVTGSAETAIGGFVKVKVNGTTTKVPVDQVVAGANQTVTVFACAGVSPGV